MSGLGHWVHWLLDSLSLNANSNDESLRGKVALVTGASSGIGRELAAQMVGFGMKVILAARTTDKLTELRESLKGNLHTPCVLTLDLEDLESLKGKAKEALDLFGRVDILVNNAGVSVRGGALETELSVHQRLMRVNYFGCLELTTHLVPEMVRNRTGTVVVVSSVQGRLATPHRSAYTASKHALQAWADCLRAELAHTGVGVLVVSPGYVNTQLSSNALTQSGQKYGKLDSNTESGYSVQYVAQMVLDNLISGQNELVLAPIYMRLAILIRALMPWLYFFIMKKRAAKYNVTSQQ